MEDVDRWFVSYQQQKIPIYVHMLLLYPYMPSFVLVYENVCIFIATIFGTWFILSLSLLMLPLLSDKAKVIYAPPEVYLPFGQPAVLDCHFRANPPLKNLRWEKDGLLFDSYNVPVSSSLKVIKLTKNIFRSFFIKLFIQIKKYHNLVFMLKFKIFAAALIN